MMSRCLIGLLAASAWTGQLHAAVNLDQLSDCSALREALAVARAARGGCRNPQSTAEQRVLQMTQMGGARACWLVRPPTLKLARFACLRMGLPGTSYHLECIAPALRADVDDFRTNYETRWASTAADYVASASRCSIGNGNATRAVRTLFLGPLVQVSRFEIGFALPLGRALTGNGMALHGYASGDPEVFTEGTVIEFFTIWQR